LLFHMPLVYRYIKAAAARSPLGERNGAGMAAKSPSKAAKSPAKAAAKSPAKAPKAPAALPPPPPPPPMGGGSIAAALKAGLCSC
jgi:hypothetical protein